MYRWYHFYACLFAQISLLCMPICTPKAFFFFFFWNHLKLFFEWIILTYNKCHLILLHCFIGFSVQVFTHSLRIDLLHKVPNDFPVIHQKMYVFHHTVSKTTAFWICSPNREIQLTKWQWMLELLLLEENGKKKCFSSSVWKQSVNLIH